MPCIGPRTFRRLGIQPDARALMNRVSKESFDSPQKAGDGRRKCLAMTSIRSIQVNVCCRQRSKSQDFRVSGRVQGRRPCGDC